MWSGTNGFSTCIWFTGAPNLPLPFILSTFICIVDWHILESLLSPPNCLLSITSSSKSYPSPFFLFSFLNYCVNWSHNSQTWKTFQTPQKWKCRHPDSKHCSTVFSLVCHVLFGMEKATFGFLSAAFCAHRRNRFRSSRQCRSGDEVGTLCLACMQCSSLLSSVNLISIRCRFMEPLDPWRCCPKCPEMSFREQLCPQDRATVRGLCGRRWSLLSTPAQGENHQSPLVTRMWRAAAKDYYWDWRFIDVHFSLFPSGSICF